MKRVVNDRNPEHDRDGWKSLRAKFEETPECIRDDLVFLIKRLRGEHMYSAGLPIKSKVENGRIDSLFRCSCQRLFVVLD